MINGIYQSAAGLDGLVQMQETLAHNLANISTAGFKKDQLQFEQSADGTIQAKHSVDRQNGPLQITGAPLQAALTGDGYFVVATPKGPAYTRNGNFSLDAQGRLLSSAGYPVQGEKGDIEVGSEKFTISGNGEILVAGNQIDKLQVVQGKDSLRPIGNGLFLSPDDKPLEAMPDGKIQVLQGALEGSNADLMESMVDMLAAVRLYEANQKALESQDEALNQTITQVGRVA